MSREQPRSITPERPVGQRETHYRSGPTDVGDTELESFQRYSADQSGKAYASLEDIGRLLQRPGQVMQESYEALRSRVTAARDNLAQLEDGLHQLQDSPLTQRMRAENKAVLKHLEDCLRNTDEQLKVIQDNRERLNKNWSLRSDRYASAPTGETADMLSRWKAIDQQQATSKPAEPSKTRKLWNKASSWVKSWF